MSEQAPIHPAFAPHLLNPQGVEKTNRIRWAFSVLMCRMEEDLPPGRELALVRTKLEEACMFALRGVSVAADNQATAQPGQIETYETVINHYDAEMTGARCALTAAGVPEVADGKSLSMAERVRLLTAALCSSPAPIPEIASNEAVARRLYQVYAHHADWKDYRGEPLPTFDQMRDATKAHWLHVAEDLAIYGTTTESNDRRIAETARA